MKLTPERRQIESGEYPLAKTLSGISFPDEPISSEAIYSKNPHKRTTIFLGQAD